LIFVLNKREKARTCIYVLYYFGVLLILDDDF